MFGKIRLVFVLVAILSTSISVAQTPARLRTPVVENRGQVSAAELERQARQLPNAFYLEGPGERKQLALTFDDGPSEDTAALLDVLKQENVKATFFWQGQNVLQYPQLVKRAIAEGHTLANHSFNHPNLTKLEADQQWWTEQIQKTQAAFEKVAGFQPALMRPPYGFIHDSQVQALQQQGIKTILWSVDSADWYHIWQNSVDTAASAQIESVIKQYVHPEAIVLLHDAGGRGRKPTVMAVKALIPQLRQQGYSFTTVDQLLNIPAKLKASTAIQAAPSLEQILATFFQLHNHANAPDWARVLDDDFVLNSAAGQVRGIQGYREYMQQLHQQFPGLKIESLGAVSQVNQQALFGWRLLDQQGAQIAQGVNTVQLGAAGKIKTLHVYMDRKLN